MSDNYYEIYQQAEALFERARDENKIEYCQESFEYYQKAVEANENFYYLDWAHAVKWLADQNKGEERKALLQERVRILEMEREKLGKCDTSFLGETWEALGDLDEDVLCYEKAKTIYEKIVEEFPKYSLMYLWIGDCNRKLGRLKSDETLLRLSIHSFEKYEELMREFGEKEIAPANLLLEKAYLDLAILQEKDEMKRYFLQIKHASAIFQYVKDSLDVDRTLMYPDLNRGMKSLYFDMEHNKEWSVLREDTYYKTVVSKIQAGIIKGVEDGLKAPLKVRVLDLSGRNIKKSEISSEIGRFENLEELILDYNQILDGLPEELYSLPKLTKVSARYCRHYVLEDLAQIPNLKVLDATGMIFGYLQEDKEKTMRKLLGLKNLEELYLNATDLKALPDYLEELTNLKVLSLDQNPIEEFPPVILKLRKLQKLSIWRNYLTKLPRECWMLPDLKELWIGFNKWNEESKAEMDEIYQEIRDKKPDFLTDYKDDVPPRFVFQPCIDQRIKKLGVVYSEHMPRYGIEFYIDDYNQFLPLTITQILFGYSWGGKKFALSDEGKRKLTLLPMDEPVIEFTNGLFEQQSEYFRFTYPSVYIGCLSIKRKRTKLLMIMKEDGRLQRDLTNPDICLEITKKMGYKVIDFFEFLSYLIPLEESVINSKNGKGKKTLTEQTKEETDNEFSQLIQTFVDAMKEDGDTQIQMIWLFNKRCNKFFKNQPTASIASVALGIAQLGIPYEMAIADLTWARTLGTRAKKDS